VPQQRQPGSRRDRHRIQEERARANREARQWAIEARLAAQPIPPGYRGAIYEPDPDAIADRDFVQFVDETEEELLRRIRRGYEDPEGVRRVRRWRTLQRDAVDTARVNRQTLSERVLTRREREAAAQAAAATFTRERQEDAARRREREQERERRARSPTPTRTAATGNTGDDAITLVQGSETPEGRRPTEEDYNWQPTFY
jgi:hypothetical protein